MYIYITAALDVSGHARVRMQQQVYQHSLQQGVSHLR